MQWEKVFFMKKIKNMCKLTLQMPVILQLLPPLFLTPLCHNSFYNIE